MITRPLWTLIVMLTLAGPCYALDVLDQLWPELDVFVKTSQNSRLFFMGAGTRVRQGGYTDGQLGAHFDMYFGAILRKWIENRPDATRRHFLSVRVGYVFGKTPKCSPDPFVEHTPIIDVNTALLPPEEHPGEQPESLRFRFIDGVYTPRYRNRLKIERTFHRGKRAITPYGHVEGFYDRRFNGFHRFRYSAGGEFEINKRFVLEGYYLRQQDSQAEPRGLNVAGIRLQIYFH